MPCILCVRATGLLLFGRKIRTRLDALRPDLSKTVEHKQLQQKSQHDKCSRTRDLTTRDKVYVRNFRPGRHWLPGFLLRTAGPCSFMAKLLDGRVVRRHRNHIRRRDLEIDEDQTSGGSTVDDLVDVDASSSPARPRVPQNPAPAVRDGPLLRYPSRERRPPERYDPS